MPQTFDDYLVETLDAVQDEAEGEVHEVPQALADADPGLLAAALCTTDGERHAAGDAEHEATVQSVSKAFVYALALEQHGIGEVLRAVDAEPSREAYNVISVEALAGAKDPALPPAHEPAPVPALAR